VLTEINPDEYGVRIGPLDGFRVRFYAGGTEAADALVRSGLAWKSTDPDSPYTVDDLLRVAAGRDGFLLLATQHYGSIGYILGQVHPAGKEVRQLFIYRAWSQGPREGNHAAFQALEQIGRALGCRDIAMIAPPAVARLMRQYQFVATATYMVRALDE
jgi:hypothetical protein